MTRKSRTESRRARRARAEAVAHKAVSDLDGDREALKLVAGLVKLLASRRRSRAKH